jgi:cellobiose-specific phosphotransferase system component IIA
MDAIKKKMQAMKAEKDNAMDRADTCEQQSRDANLRAEKVQSKTFLPDQKEMTTFASLVLFMFRRQLTSINGK